MDRDTLIQRRRPHRPTTATAPTNDEVEVAKLKPAKLDGVELKLHGVDHTARPTWRLRETVEFYRDILGLPLVHTISARGWGQEGHPDFLHSSSMRAKARPSRFSTTRDRSSRQIHPGHYFYSATHRLGCQGRASALEGNSGTARGHRVPYTVTKSSDRSISRPNGYRGNPPFASSAGRKDAELTLAAAIERRRARQQRNARHGHRHGVATQGQARRRIH